MRDPYEILGVAKDADKAAIKKAYRKLAKKFHPDSNRDDKTAEQKFSEATAAYDLLNDAEKRKAYDRGEIDAEGNPKFKGFEGFAAGGGPFRARGAGGGFHAENVDVEDIFSQIFGGLGGGMGGGFRGARQGAGMRVKGADVQYTLAVPLRDAARGATQRITLPGGKTLDVKIPAGVADGQQIRLKGQGGQGSGGGPAGDALITITVEDDPLFKREGRDLRVDVPITFYEAVLGAKVRVPTLDGSVELKVPANANTGMTLRLKGKGLPAKDGGAGDMLATLKVIMPDKGGDELRELAEKWAKERPYTVRGGRFAKS